MLTLFNTLTQRLEVFTPIEEGLVKMYTCGPTVYDYPHIGNFRTFIFQDVLRRYLKFKEYKVLQVMNITDVDDKTIRGARREGVSLREYTEKYAKAFFEDLRILNIEPVEVYPRATDHIREMVELVKKLIEKGYAYFSEGSVYFDISKFAEYGSLSKVRLKGLKAGVRVKADEYAKDQVEDFALWKAWDKDDGDVFWDTELGRGRPGWHIECSAMSMKHLGATFDVHSGGVDLVFPHHENEIAQSEAATGHKFVNYWLHVEHLLVNGQKMAKSLGNYYTLRDLLSKGYDPTAIRYFLLSGHYRSQLNFTEEALKHAHSTVSRITDFIQRISQVKKKGPRDEDIHSKTIGAERRFEDAMDNDLNMPIALSAIFEFIREINRIMDAESLSKENSDEIYGLFQRFDSVLGVLKIERFELSEEDLKLIQSREEARRRQDWATADLIRAKLLEKGIALEDTPQGVRYKKKA